MAHKHFVLALGMIVAASPVSATSPDRYPLVAPAAPAHAKYCLRIAPITGSRIETIQCRTREEWARIGLDVDEEWAEEGVRIIT